MNSNNPDPHYREHLQAVAEALKALKTPLYIVTHVDPDGDAIGSSLGLARALKALGKEVIWIAEPPRYLRFLARDQELHPALQRVPEGATLLVLDSAEPGRVTGAPVEGRVINLDHHGTNPRFGDLWVVDPSKSATAQIVKDLIDLLGVRWTPEIATPVLTGLITDTGNFAFANTTPEVLHTAAELVGYGVELAELTDRLRWRPPEYFRALGQVMETVRFHFGGLLVTAHLPAGLEVEDSDDFVGQIRYAEGAQIAVFLRERPEGVKLSIRSRGGVSAQAVAVSLGGGGHVPAAGATLRAMGLEAAYLRLLPAVEAELRKAGYWAD
ncbi:DHH family phosphoesterase [Meiothermus granaticius]|uniref:Bifunctional oligoribonuclease and PAP phosphatase NrnA n=1 Tax=Meiothermus granaticius NBRC 107808 TaxID=1227551 RepID=A0A399F551_9DEIN|nr:bifunctional oligoribonuclease/PAP phosphatase NrnA [Meiothermus granaticius]MCL6526237.1 bifunctional oligoribonuclease/PAP phosphatase NrnA [Thermaceae bacterium]RIH91190.1 Bifunctional oligoribonuclease and PAP phosphatase NrnA [Meiothermus granaticius NBRC 107808]GEM87477.1 bifunctional oligoribonuclease and PAP phosphatase NrnA [Meiothermus granaticius NBRC 107808]